MGNNVLAIDIGGSKISVGVINENGLVLKNQKRALPSKYTDKEILNVVFDLIQPLLDYNLKAVGIAVPGLTDSKAGVWEYAPFSSLGDFKICELVSKKTNLPCFAENDVNVCAIGEKYYGLAKGVDNFIWITISNGVGGAFYLNGQLFVGENGYAGEIGHFYVNNKSYVCGCGKRGCLETFASGQAISREYFRRTGVNVPAKRVFELAELNDRNAIATIKRAGTALGKALSYCVNALNINNIYLGGGVSESLPLLKPYVDKELSRRVFNQANGKVNISRTALGYDAALIGAGALAWSKL